MTERIIASIHQSLGISGVNTAGLSLCDLALGAINARVVPILVGTHEAVSDAAIAGSVWGSRKELVVASWPSGASPLVAMCTLRETLRTINASAVIGHDCALAYAATASLRHLGVTSGLWHHSSGHDGDDILRLSLPLCDRATAVSSQLRQRIESIAGEIGLPHSWATDHLEPHALPVATSIPVHPAPWLPNSRTLRLLYAGRLERVHKRIMDLAGLADALRDLGVRFRLTVAGDGPAAHELCTAVHQHVCAGRIEFLGTVPHHDMPALYGAHDLTILVSNSEGMPLTIAEAMAAGRGVVITTGCGGATQYVRDNENGIVVPTGDVTLMAKRLAELAQDRSALRRMGSEARTTAFAQLGTDAMHDKFISFMSCLLRRNAERSLHETHANDAGHSAAYSNVYTGIVRALRGLGHVSEAELESWRVTWSRELHERNITIDPVRLVTPQHGPVLHAQACIQQLVLNLRTGGDGCIALFGAGAFTRKLSQAMGGLRGICDFVIDDAPPDDGQIGGVPAVTPMTLPQVPDAVIVCSDEYGHLLVQRAREVLPPQTKVLAYNDLPLPSAAMAA
jgi:glycosyltransferase involved in cell wall biosynthesis